MRGEAVSHRWNNNVCERCGMWRRRQVSYGRPGKRVTVRYYLRGEVIARDPEHVPPCPAASEQVPAGDAHRPDDG